MFTGRHVRLNSYENHINLSYFHWILISLRTADKSNEKIEGNIFFCAVGSMISRRL